MKKGSDEIIHLQFNKLTKYHSYTYRWSNRETLLHEHVDFYELSMITQGNYYHTYDNQTTVAEEGTLILFDIGEKHALTSKLPGSIHFTLCLAKPYFRLLMQLFSFDQYLFDNQGMLCRKLDEHAFHYLLDIVNTLTGGEDESSNVKLFFYNALSLLLKNTSESLLSSDNLVDDILKKMRNYTYLTLPIQDIYAQYPYSPSTIIKKFKQRTGMTLVRYQSNVRLDFAARLMRETTQSIEQIASDLGFLSASHFFEIFKERYGHTPNSYRKLVQDNPENYEFIEMDDYYNIK